MSCTVKETWWVFFQSFVQFLYKVYGCNIQIHILSIWTNPKIFLLLGGQYRKRTEYLLWDSRPHHFFVVSKVWRIKYN